MMIIKIWIRQLYLSSFKELIIILCEVMGWWEREEEGDSKTHLEAEINVEEQGGIAQCIC